MLFLIPCSRFAFLSSGKQSVAEHSFLTKLIVYTLAKQIDQSLNVYKLMMCLFHDLPKAYIGDLNYLQKNYVKAYLNKALEDIRINSSLGSEIVEWIQEFENNQTLEA